MDKTLRSYVFDTKSTYLIDSIIDEATRELRLCNYKLICNNYDYKLKQIYNNSIEKCENVCSLLIDFIDFEEGQEEKMIDTLETLNQDEFIIITNLVLTYIIHEYENKYIKLIEYTSKRILDIYHNDKYKFFIELFGYVISLDEFL